MPNASQWNSAVANKVKALGPIKTWLRSLVDDNDLDWESQKSAHHALQFLVLAEYEIWNMQYSTTQEPRDFYNEGEDTDA